MTYKLKNKTVLITGACGTVGQAILKELEELNDDRPNKIIGIDNNESGIFFLEQEYKKDTRFEFYVIDIKNSSEIRRITRGVELVLHCAAMKHVILSEKSPDNAVETNIKGLQNIINAALENKIEKVIFTSSDKAVNPTNVMGATKLLGERLITAANDNQKEHKTIFSSTRFGNVLGSNGSVVQIFKKQIYEGNPLTITDKSMTRFVMSKEESARLVIDSAKIAKGGEVFVTKMPVVNIAAMGQVLARKIKNLSIAEDYPITEIGTKAGEKLYEELMTTEEVRRAVEVEQYFIVYPALQRHAYFENVGGNDLTAKRPTKPYVSESEPCLTDQQILDLLVNYRIL